ncbi:peptide ABC transporter substrate-binding protein [Caproiciproducens galactitolivorans]|uniref:Peptide ABC transporter substrate-binding protein n=1 Tax=Caproiciproducens galactitolivorans TaxID=642589 RepID=A0ABT4BRI1_9FIRM|nr:peptide ABC transporter substrate-binding protein [Caproiciproducens galactitolivorans]MCY1713510.1 peptide ABC transporter substrate-binding protein [Caproiciproducens galactitolivorans]
MGTKKVLSILIAGIMAFSSLSGCGTPSPSGSSGSASGNTQTSSAGGAKTLNLAVPTAVMSLDPLIAGDSVSMDIISNIDEGLFVVDADGNIQPGLCKNYEVSKDQLTYTFHLRDGITWNNGEPVTAQDFVYAWQRNATATGDLSAFQYQIEMAAIKNQAEVISKKLPVDKLGVKAPDNKTIQLELEHPVPFLLNLLAFTPWVPVNQAFLESQGDKFGVTKDNILYNGPYYISNYEVGGNTITLTKNPKYWDADKVDVGTVIIQVISDTQQAVMSYKNNTVDNVELTGDLVSQNSSDPEFSSVLGPYNYYLLFNTKIAGLDNKDFRQAIAYAIDRKSLCSNVLNNGSVPAYNMTMKGLCSNSGGKDFTEASGQYFEYNPQKAKESWAKAKAETKLREVTIVYDQEKDFAANTCTFIKSALESTLDGLTVNIEATPKKNRLQKEADHNYQICLHAWGPDYSDPTAILAMYKSNHPSNYSQWNNKEFDTLYDKANSADAGNEAARWQDLIQCNNICTEQAVCVPIFQTGFAQLTRKTVSGLSNHLTGVKCFYKFVKIK